MTSEETCDKCVMDTTDPDITFTNFSTAHGDVKICNHCLTYNERVNRSIPMDSLAQIRNITNRIKKDRTSKYDCVIGISGGVDSSWALYLASIKYGLNPLAVHLDNGWNSEVSTWNISNLCNRMFVDLYTHVIDWEEFVDLQKAFLLSGTPDSEIPSDHAITAAMVQVARKFGIKWIVTGNNVRTESHLPRAWSQGHWDWAYIKDVWGKFGKKRRKTFPRLLPHQLLGPRWVRILNFIPYDRQKAKDQLMLEFGYKDYGNKHHESIYTRWYQQDFLVNRFGYDKRKTHLSSMICSGLVTREEALEKLKEEPDPRQLQADREYIRKKLNVTEGWMEMVMHLPERTRNDFHNWSWLLDSEFFQKRWAKRQIVL